MVKTLKENPIFRSVMLTGLFLLVLSINCVYGYSYLFDIVSTNDNYTEIEFNLNEYEIYPVEVDGVTYYRLFHPDAGYLMNAKYPEVLSFSFMLSIPRTGTAEVEQPKILKSKVIDDIMLFPSQGYDLKISEKDGFLIDDEHYQKDANYPEYSVQISEPSIMRDTRLVSVTLYPFVYNASSQELTVRERMTVRVNYDQSTRGYNELTGPERRISRGFERVKKGLLLNYGQFRNPNLEYQPRSILVIYHHSSTITTLVKQFIDWKRDKGFVVHSTDTSNLSTAHAIAGYVRNAYLNWDVPPEYVALIGGSGSLTIPHNSGDHHISLITDDNYSDVFVGRISVPDAQGLATAWNKIRNYERTPFLGDTSWYERNALIADLHSHSPTIPNASPLFLMKYIKEMMLTHNEDNNITEIYESPFPARMTSAMNAGGTFFWYRGAIGVSGWSPSENLNNGYRMPNANFVTCSTLDFNGGRTTEPAFRVGTPTVAKGAVSAVGFIGGVNTGPGNALTAGTLNGVYVDGIRTIGESLVYSKTNLWRTYENSHPQQATQHARGGNLIGDPSMDIWVDIPDTLIATYPDSLAQGSNSIVITVTDNDDRPIEGAWVTIRQLDEDDDGDEFESVFHTGYTGADGVVVRFFDSDIEGEIRVTVTKPDYIPHLGSFDLYDDPAVSYDNIVLNGDLIAGNEVRFALIARNHQDNDVEGVSGTISTDSEFINIINSTSAFGNIDEDDTAESLSDYTIDILPDTPANHNAIIDFTVTDNNDNSWISRFMLTIINGNLVVDHLDIIDDGGDGAIDPLEEADLRFFIKNNGNITIPNVQGTLSGDIAGLSIVDHTAHFGDIYPDETIPSIEDHFRVSTSTYVIPGMIFDLELHLFNEEGFSQRQIVKLPIGTVTVDTPLGPCEYGYWIYDCGDEGFIDSPEYDWIEIAPGNEGFAGREIDIDSDYDNIQEFETVDLPFTFTFYGEDYDEITISTNGWIAFGETEQGTQRNWRIPGPLGPSPMVAAFWDNLRPGSGGIYTYYWEERNKYIIQWENNQNVLGNEINTFQIILYDPNSYYTTTFDGPIKIQYKVFNNVNNGANSPSGIGNWGNYCSVGIRNHLNNTGLEYTFNDTYPTAARPIEDETALYITTGLGSALVAIENFSFTSERKSMPEYGEIAEINMSLQNVGIEDAFEVEAVLTSEDPYITVLQDSYTFGDIEIEQSIPINEAFVIEVADDVPHLHRAHLRLTISADDNLLWSYALLFNVSAPSLKTLIPFVHDPAPGGNENGFIDAGEELIMYIPIQNEGSTSQPVTINVNSECELSTITEISDANLPFISSKETQFPAVHLSISDDVEVGDGIRFSYTYQTGNYEFVGHFLVGAGGIIPVQMGRGDNTTGTTEVCPLNIYYLSNRSQFIYTVDEFNAEGIFGEFPINQFGFYVEGAPANSLSDFSIKMRHTTADDASSHHGDNLVTVYSTDSYSPTAGDWDLITLDEPFVWNGIDNVLIDTSFSPVSGWNASGQIKIYDYQNGYRYAADDTDQRNAATDTVNNNKPQSLLMMGIDPDAVANRPRNLTGTTVDTGIELSWEAPRGNRDFTDDRRRRSDNRSSHENRNATYNVYRNGVLLTDEPIVTRIYVDTTAEGNKNYHYYVTAVIDDMESTQSNLVSIRPFAADAPIFDLSSGVYHEPIFVTITSETDESVVYYTLDGTDPTEDDYLYEEPVEILYHSELRAKAVRDGWIDSPVVAAQYYILYPPDNPMGVGSTSSVSLSWDEPWSQDNNLNHYDYNSLTGRMRTSRSRAQSRNNYRTDVKGYNIYRSIDKEAFDKINDELIEDLEYNDLDLEINVYYYYLTAVYEQGESGPTETMPVGVGIATKPVFDPEPGSYDGQVEVSIINTAGPRATVYYTLDGSEPNEDSQEYTGFPIVIETTTTIRTYAVRDDWKDSEIARGMYRIREVSVEDDDTVPALKTELLAAYPNPFNPYTNISFSLKESDNVTIEIYNILGKKVKTLVDDYIQAGNHSMVWNGQDANSRRVSSGIYFYRMQTSNYSSIRKIVLLK